jgi:hypothetical protein
MHLVLSSAIELNDRGRHRRSAKPQRQIQSLRVEALWLRSKGAVPIGILLPSTPVAGAPARAPDEIRAVKLELIIAGLVVQQMSGLIGYWAAFSDERGVFHFAFTSDLAYADLSPENAARRTRALVALDRAIERHRAKLESVRVRLHGR